MSGGDIMVDLELAVQAMAGTVSQSRVAPSRVADAMQ